MEKKKCIFNSILWGGIFLIAVSITVTVWITYNGIVKAQNRVDEAAGQVEAVLQRRLDLIPNLVETVKGYTVHEKTTLEAVVMARNSAVEMLRKSPATGTTTVGKVSMIQLAGAQDQLSRAILALVENYPDLKANANFLALQDQLEGTENRIAVERLRYNDDVRVYNTRISVFPGTLVAGIFKFTKREYFEASVEARNVPKVGF
jgi:LemA protein